MGLGEGLEGKVAEGTLAEAGSFVAAPPSGSPGGGGGDSTAGERAATRGVRPPSGEGTAISEPCTLDQFAEMMAARGAWAEQGRDVSAMLEQHFGLTALEWSNLGAYWNVKIGSNYRLGVELGKLVERYKARFSSGWPPPA